MLPLRVLTTPDSGRLPITAWISHQRPRTSSQLAISPASRDWMSVRSEITQ